MANDPKSVATNGKESHYKDSDTEDEVDDLFELWFKQVDNKTKTTCPKINVLLCDRCSPSRLFKKQKTLDQHNAIFHTNNKRFVCKFEVTPDFECGQRYYNKTQLKMHKILYKHK